MGWGYLDFKRKERETTPVLLIKTPARVAFHLQSRDVVKRGIILIGLQTANIFLQVLFQLTCWVYRNPNSNFCFLI